MSSVRINLSRTLKFYDIADKDVKGHASSLKAMSGEEMNLALLVHYLHEVEGWKRAKVLEGACAGAGARLDAWLATHRRSPLLYQVEVKSWSVHGYGGAPLAYSETMTEPERADYLKKSWAFYFEKVGRSYRFRHPAQLGKVLRRMRPRPGFTEADAAPLACLWTSLHPQGKPEPFFTVPIVAAEGSEVSEYKTLTVFSASTYLRNMASEGVEYLVLDLPRLNARMQLLSQLFSIAEPEGVDLLNT